MATQLFLLDSGSDTHLATNNANLRGTASAWVPGSLGTARGSGVIASDSTGTVAGATPGVEVLVGSTPKEFISPPVAADVTISGTITANVWASESNMSANVAINVVIEIIRANETGTANSNTLVEIVRSTRTTEVAVTTRAVNNFTTGMTSGAYTSQTLNRGDRLRIRIYGDDSTANMGSGFTFNASWSGTTGGADGDTFVTFTEDFSFESAPAGSTLYFTTTQASLGTGAALLSSFTGSDENPLSEGGNWAQLDTGTNQLQRISNAVASTAAALGYSYYSAADYGPNLEAYVTISTLSGSHYMMIRIQSPGGANLWDGYRIAATSTGTNISVVTNNAATILVSTTAVTWASGDKLGVSSNSAGLITVWKMPSGGSTWQIVIDVVDNTHSTTGKIGLGATATTARMDDLYVGNTTGTFPMEMWTSRGAGVVSRLIATTTGWTAPLQIGEWYSKQLSAFTLEGMAQANLRALESATTANASLRCEIARVDADGTNATVWGTWCISAVGVRTGELSTSEAAETAWVSGDSLAISAGQRLRIRLYIDDFPGAAMASGQSATFFYNGTSGGASGDSYIILPQSVSEFVAAAFVPRNSGTHFQDPAVL